jgi:hypothetical protein
MGLQVDASAEDWAALLADDTPFVEESSARTAELLAPSEEVSRVSRRIAGQYVEVLAHFASRAFAGEAEDATLAQAASAVDALLRLADATGDRVQSRLLVELGYLLEPVARTVDRSRSRSRALTRLREWLPDFAATLEPDDAERLLALVRWDAATVPLLEELQKLRGMGPKRLERLYAAGLFSVDTVASAEPEDIAAVTGIPRALAEEVVAATRRYAADEPERCVAQLVRTIHRLRSIAGRADSLDPAALQALLEVEATLAALSAPAKETP